MTHAICRIAKGMILAGAFASLTCAQAWAVEDGRTATAADFARGFSESAPDAHAAGGLLLLEVTVNGSASSDPLPAEVKPDGRLVLGTAAWTKLRLVPRGPEVRLSDGSAGYVLSNGAGLTYRLDARRQRLEITAPASAFALSKLGSPTSRSPPPDRSPPGVYVTYALSSTFDSKGLPSYGGALDAVAFAAPGVLTSDGVVSGRGGSVRYVRTDSYFEKDLPGPLESLVVGDAITASGAWSEPARFAGVRFARDFAIDPAYITFPTPEISGSAALPSTADLLINGIRRGGGLNVDPGPFAIRNLPVVTGAGEINLVVRDPAGVATVITQSYYAAPNLLRPGLSDFSLEAGALRRRYAVSGYDYADGFAAGAYRLGLSDEATLGGRVEAEARRQAAGADVTLLISRLGVLEVDAAYAAQGAGGDVPAGSGARWGVSFTRTSLHGQVSFGWDHYDEGFRRFGVSAESLAPHDRVHVGASYPVAEGVSVGATYLDQSDWTASRTRLAGVNASARLPAGLQLRAYGTFGLSSGSGTSFGLALTHAFGTRGSASLSAGGGQGSGGSETLSVSDSPPIGPGMGWRAELVDGRQREATAGVTENLPDAQVLADVDVRPTDSAARLSLNGSFGWIDGLVFASRRIDGGAFAVVQTGDLAGVRVYRANQYEATTDAHGRALIADLLPYQDNRITIDADALPMDVEIDTAEAHGRPAARSGVFVSVPVRRSRNALVVLVLETGGHPPAGSTAEVDGSGRGFTVANGGEVYLEGLAPRNSVRVSWADGACRLDLDVPDALGPEPRIGPLVCKGVKP